MNILLKINGERGGRDKKPNFAVRLVLCYANQRGNWQRLKKMDLVWVGVSLG